MLSRLVVLLPLLFSLNAKAVDDTSCDSLFRSSGIIVDQVGLPSDMAFHLFQGGTYEMGEPGRKVTVILTYPFEFGETPVTKKQWRELMGEDSSFFTESGDHAPAENMTELSAWEYANRLSLKLGLKPALDLSALTLRGRAENGTLIAIGGKLRINAQDNDIYKAEGFIIPPQAVTEYVLRNSGKVNRLYPMGLDPRGVLTYAWTTENSDGITHSVKSKPPLMMGKSPIYSLIGNVWEWQSDAVEYPLIGGVNPQMLGRFDSDRILRGGSWYDGVRYTSAGFRYSAHPKTRSPDVGFRLMRFFHP